MVAKFRFGSRKWKVGGSHLIGLSGFLSEAATPRR